MEHQAVIGALLSLQRWMLRGFRRRWQTAVDERQLTVQLGDETWGVVELDRELTQREAAVAAETTALQESIQWTPCDHIPHSRRAPV